MLTDCCINISYVLELQPPCKISKTQYLNFITKFNTKYMKTRPSLKKSEYTPAVVNIVENVNYSN